MRAIGEFGANVMVPYNPKTISIQLWEYNALGGLKLVMPGVLIVLIFSFGSLWFWVTNLRGRRKTSLVSLAEQYHDHEELSKRLGPLSLEVNDAQIFVVLVRNGSGKTTLINLVAGILQRSRENFS